MPWIIHGTRKQPRHSYYIWKQWQLLTFLLCNYKSRCQRESHRFVKGPEMSLFSSMDHYLYSRVRNMMKVTEACYYEDGIFLHNFVLLLASLISKLTLHLSFLSLKSHTYQSRQKVLRAEKRTVGKKLLLTVLEISFTQLTNYTLCWSPIIMIWKEILHPSNLAGVSFLKSTISTLMNLSMKQQNLEGKGYRHENECSLSH